MDSRNWKHIAGKVIDWTANIILAGFGLVALWLFLQVTTYASFKVPSSSMEPTLVPGDFVLVNKWKMGGRLFNVQKALEGEQVPIRRLPGWNHKDVRRNDVLVFNFPYPGGQRDSIYMDVMLYYVKRCIALPGDVLEIRDAHYYVKGHEGPLGDVRSQDQLEDMLRYESPEALKALGVRMEGVWGDNNVLYWNLLRMGPVQIPHMGLTVQLDKWNAAKYRKLIEWEQGKPVTVDEEGKAYIGGEYHFFYRFEKDYYFVAGDNSAHSNDSRYWGLVPEEYIVGVATHIWKSVNPRTGKLRWDRVMKRIR